MTHEILMAGFGGQGVMLMGQLVTEAGLASGLQVTWLPSYGPEMRGGTANCSVMLSSELIGSPVAVDPTAAIVMNVQSFDKFEPAVRSGGLLLVNSTLVSKSSNRKDITQYLIPANAIAQELGDTRVANMVMLGGYIYASKALTLEAILQALEEKLPVHRRNLLPMNKQALERGMAVVAASA
ncbi:MAG: 2-oxoacid:acceptor oxidoreductase family protein [Symbiobacteriaceae bacterium]|nr:2-oxoacid:acceptor oxidoreductase family protein [Symbiobacteriaceae bacterium]